MKKYALVPDWDAIAYSFSSSVFEGKKGDSEMVCFFSMGNSATTVSFCEVTNITTGVKTMVHVPYLLNYSICVT